MEDGVLAEFLIERKEEMGVAGNIYKGKVARVFARHASRLRRYRHGKGRLFTCIGFFVPEDVQLIYS